MRRARAAAALALCCAAAACADAMLSARPAPLAGALQEPAAPAAAPRAGSMVIRLRTGTAPPGVHPAAFIVDGRMMTYAEFVAARLHPDDIIAVTVLKGADAVQLYGPAGTHGMVVFTTRAAAGR